MNGCFSAIFRSFTAVSIVIFVLVMVALCSTPKHEETQLESDFWQEQAALEAEASVDYSFNLSQEWESCGLSFLVDPSWKIQEYATHEGWKYFWGIGEGYTLAATLYSRGETQSYEHFAQVMALSQETIDRRLASFVESWEQDGVTYSHYCDKVAPGTLEHYLYGYCPNGMGFSLQLRTGNLEKSKKPEGFDNDFISHLHFDAEAAFAMRAQVEAGYVPREGEYDSGVAASSDAGSNGSSRQTPSLPSGVSAPVGDGGSRYQDAVAAGDDLLADGVSSYEELIAELENMGFTQQEAIYATDELVPEWA